MADNGERFLQTMKLRLAEIVDADTASTILNVMCYELRDYDLAKKSTEIVPYECDNLKVLKTYTACLIVEGKSPKTAKQYCYSIKNLFRFLGNKKYDEITSRDIMTWLAYYKVGGKKSDLACLLQGWRQKEQYSQQLPQLRKFFFRMVV